MFMYALVPRQGMFTMRTNMYYTVLIAAQLTCVLSCPAHDKGAVWCIGEYCPHKNMCPPQLMSNHSAAAQVLNLEA